MGGIKRAKQFFQKHTNCASKKFWEKKFRKKLRKTFFIFTEYHEQKIWGGNNSRNNFSRNKRIVRAIDVGKISSEKSEKNVFLYSHKYLYKKMGGGEKRAKFFFQKHKNSASKK